tara:strand:+ start:347 stop:556 length:210 start_codon:yes stop_codon:yes gene_type:complete
MWNNEQSLSQQRLQVCRSCPFMRNTPAVGPTCGTLLKPEYDMQGRKLTCGCILRAKTLMPNQHCPQNKW